MKIIRFSSLFCLGFICIACSTPPSKFGVYQQSDGTIGVNSPKDAKEQEARDVALAECQKLGKRAVTIVEARKTANDRFPMTYIYVCR